VKEYDLQNYEVICTQFFASATMVGMSISPNGIRFSMGCIRKFPGIEYIELKVHPHNHMLAVIPCTRKHKQKMRWARLHDDAVNARVISGGAFLETLYELFSWDLKIRYRLRGEIVRHGQDVAVLFNAKKPEIFSSRYDFEMPWVTSFGECFQMHRKPRLYEILSEEAFGEYNSEPTLQPTSQKVANKNIRILLDKMHNGSDLNASTRT
jgi:hypothetical protein